MALKNATLFSIAGMALYLAAEGFYLLVDMNIIKYSNSLDPFYKITNIFYLISSVSLLLFFITLYSSFNKGGGKH